MNVQDILNNLEFGKLYVFSNDAMRGKAYEQVMKSPAVVRGDWMKMFTVESILIPEDVNIDQAGFIVAARRFNTACMGRYAVLACHIPDLRNLNDGLQLFAEKLFNLNDPDDSEFTMIQPEEFVVPNYNLYDSDICMNEMAQLNYSMAPGMPCDAPDERYIERCQMPETKPKRSVSFQQRMCLRREDIALEEERKKAQARTEILIESRQEQAKIEQLERERQNDLELIKNLIVAYIAKYHADPKELFAENVQGKYVVNEQPRVVVNGDLKVVLPELNETELKMEAASRTLYIWFLLHPEGCTRSELKTHRKELVNIYSMVKPGSNYPEACVDSVLNDSTLTTNISRIKRVVKNKFLRDEVADKYYIKADNNGVYKIGIASEPQMVSMPRAITM